MLRSQVIRPAARVLRRLTRSAAPSPREPRDLGAGNVAEPSAEPFIVAPVHRIALGSPRGHGHGVVVAPKGVALVEPRVGQAAAIAGTAGKVVTRPPVHQEFDTRSVKARIMRRP